MKFAKNYMVASPILFLAGGGFAFIGAALILIGFMTRTADPGWSFACMFIGTIFALIGLPILVVCTLHDRFKDKMIERGTYVIANITNISRNPNLIINGVCPWVIECDFYDPDTRITHSFRSENVMEDPSNYIEGNEVKVYINPDNLDEYYVDLDSVIGKHVVH